MHKWARSAHPITDSKFVPSNLDTRFCDDKGLKTPIEIPCACAGRSCGDLPVLYLPKRGVMNYWRKPLDLDKIDVPRGVIHIIENQCKGCGFCVEYCPLSVLELSSAFNAKGYHAPLVVKKEECLRCQLCEIICPEFAIFVTPQNNRPVQVVSDRRKEVEEVES